MSFIKKLFQKQEIRFLFVGVLNTIVGYGLYAIFLFCHIHYLVANTLSTLLGVLHSYLWNRYFTFKSKEKAGKEIIKFSSVYFVSYFIGTLTLFGFKNIFHISPYIAGLLNLVITTFVSYFGHKYFSFRETNLKSWFKKNRKYIIPVVLFLCYFALLLMYKNIPDFTDEGDVMLGAVMLGKGKFIYVDFASQHLPFTYFFFAPFAFLGVSSVLGFRIVMYLWLCIFFVFFYLRFSPKLGQKMMIWYPILYIFFMSFGDFLGATVVSEQIQSQCLVFLMLELLVFMKEKKLSLSSKILIPIFMIISIGCAFVSIIPCFLMVLTFLYMDYKNWKKEKYLKHFWNEYRIIFVVAILFVLGFVFYLVVTGSLKECIDQAFILNTEIYSKYNGYSSNPFQTILFIVPKFIQSLSFSFQFENLISIVLCGAVGLFFLKIAKKDVVLALMLLYCILLCGNREFTGFHALPYFSVAAISALYVLQEFKIKEQILIFSLFFLCFLYQCKPYLVTIFDPYPLKQEEIQNVNLLLNSEELFRIDLDTPAYIDAKKIPGSRFDGMVPWFAEKYEDEYLQDIKEKKPNILYYEPYNNVWGYLFKDFIPKVNEYILEHYIYNSDYQIWIRKDYLDEAENILHQDFAEFTNKYSTSSTVVLQNNYLIQTITPQENVKKMEICFGTFGRINYSHVVIQIFDENEESIYEEEIHTDLLKDNAFYEIFASLKKGKTYWMVLTSKYTNTNDYVAVYKVKDDFQFDDNELSINGAEYQEDLLLQMYYE